MVLSRERWIGYRLVGAITCRGEEKSTGIGLPVLGPLDDIADIIEQQQVSVVVFTEGSFECPGDFRRLAWKLEQSRVQILVVPTLADISAERRYAGNAGGFPIATFRC